MSAKTDITTGTGTFFSKEYEEDPDHDDHDDPNHDDPMNEL